MYSHKVVVIRTRFEDELTGCGLYRVVDKGWTFPSYGLVLVSSSLNHAISKITQQAVAAGMAEYIRR
jgi:hypothetical protein